MVAGSSTTGEGHSASTLDAEWHCPGESQIATVRLDRHAGNYGPSRLGSGRRREHMSAQSHPVEARSSASTRTLVIALGGVLLVGAMLLAAFMVALNRPPAVPANGTPAATLHGYLTAWEAGDLDTAYGHFSTAVQGEMTLAEFERISNEVVRYDSRVSRRITLDDATISGDRATQLLVVDEFRPAGFGSETYTYEIRVPMVREGGAWRINIALIGVEPNIVRPLTDS